MTTFRRLCAAAGMREELLEGAFRLEEYDPGDAIEIGGLTIRFQPVPHFLPTHAVERRAATAGRITYSADSSPSEDLCAFAHGTDLLLIEATLPRPERDGPARAPDARGGRRAWPARGRAARSC